MPLGIRWNLNVSSPRTIVWPALLPPWKRMTTSACSASRSVTFPLPSSPHWAPTIASPGISMRVYAALGIGGAAEVVAHQGDRRSRHFDEPRHRPHSDLLAQLVVLQVGGD